MHHSLDHRFRHAREAAARTYRPSPRLRPFERDIGLGAHIARTMPMFLTLRDPEGTPLATALLPQTRDCDYPPSVVGPDYSDPFAGRRHRGAGKACRTHAAARKLQPFENLCFMTQVG